MNLRAALGSLQLPIAGIGALLVAVAIGGIATMPSPPPGSEGFVSGLAALFLYFVGWVGFLIMSTGLAIPPGEGYGITFDRRQRWLFVTAAVAGFLSAIGPFVAFGLLLSNPSLMVSAWLALMGVAIAALLLGIAWRIGQEIGRAHV